jgi:hypothetical protein
MMGLLLVGYAPGQQPKAAPKQPQSHWHSSSSKNELDGIVTTTLTLHSSNFGGAGALVIRCGGDQAEIYVALGDYVQPELGGGHSVRIKFDAEAPITEDWTESTDSRGLFTYAPLPLLHKLLRIRQFLFEFTPFEKRSKVFSFDLFGLVRAVAPIERSCGELTPGTEVPYK